MRGDPRPAVPFPRRGRRALVAAILYAAACALPALESRSYHYSGVIRGWEAAAMGWVGERPHPGHVPWSANLAFLGGLVCLLAGRLRSAAVLGGMAFLLGLGSWAFPALAETRLLAGYYVWQASHLALCGLAGRLAWPGRGRLSLPDTA